MAGAQKTSQFDLASSVAATDEAVVLQGGQLKRISVGKLVGLPQVGWIATGETWTYNAWDSVNQIATLNVPSGATTKYSVGMKIEFTQATGGKKYGKITQVVSTTVIKAVLVSGTLINQAITAPFYSVSAQPFGYPEATEDYSTSEVNTGFKWVDGKTIFKKTVNTGAITANKNVAHGISSPDTFISIVGMGKASGDTFQHTLPMISSVSGNSLIGFSTNDTNIRIGTSANLGIGSSYVTLHYTKT